MADYETISFETPKDFADWLEKHHANTDGIWIRMYKKATGIPSVNHDSALHEALCYGWIDGQVKPFDDQSWLQKFTPRRPRSIWSKRNIEHIERLTKEGKMKPAGLQQVEAAKADGRWAQAYDTPSDMTVPDDFLQELAKNKKAESFFKTLNKSNTYTIGWRLQTAKKPETRVKRMQLILAMLSKGEKFY